MNKVCLLPEQHRTQTHRQPTGQKYQEVWDGLGGGGGGSFFPFEEERGRDFSGVRLSPRLSRPLLPLCSLSVLFGFSFASISSRNAAPCVFQRSSHFCCSLCEAA